jgi:hypothetical protein
MCGARTTTQNNHPSQQPGGLSMQRPAFTPFRILLLLSVLLLLLTTQTGLAAGDELTKCQIAYQNCILSLRFLLPNVAFESYCAAGYIWCVVFLE